MHKININLINHFYIDVSDFTKNLIITQFQQTTFVKAFNNKTLIKIFIIYDSFIFASIHCKYLIYKRELYIIVKFIKKYDYLYKHFYYIIIMHIDYKPFTYFLKSDMHKKIYKH